MTVVVCSVVVACSVCAAVGTPLLDSSVEDISSACFTKDQVVSSAVFLADVLRYESQFVPVSSLSPYGVTSLSAYACYFFELGYLVGDSMVYISKGCQENLQKWSQCVACIIFSST